MDQDTEAPAISPEKHKVSIVVQEVKYPEIEDEVGKINRAIWTAHQVHVPGLEDAATIFVARKPNESRIIGILDIRPLPNKPRTAEISYRVSPEDEGHGVATQLVELVSEEIKKGGEYDILSASVIPGSASERVLTKAGFQIADAQPERNRTKFYKNLR